MTEQATEPTRKPTRDWYGVGETYVENDARREEIKRVAASLTWTDTTKGNVRGPMSPVLLIQEVIKQLRLPKVTAVAWGGDGMEYPDGPETATYGMVGIECNYSDGTRVRTYLLDTGIGATPLFSDLFHPETPETVTASDEVSSDRVTRSTPDREREVGT